MSRNNAPFSWLIRMAWRDARVSRSRILLFMAATVLGIAALVAIQSFSRNLQDQITLQSKELMGADFTIDSDDPPNERVQFLIDSLGGAQAREISFASMAVFPKTDATKLVQVRAIDGSFPLFGSIETNPEEAASRFARGEGALADATLMAQLGLAPGDSIKIGSVFQPILGALKQVPGSNSFFGAIAPPVLVPYETAENSGLLQTGSRIDYEWYFKASDTTDLVALDEELDPVLDAQQADLDTHLSTSERLGRRYDNFGRFLNLVAFIALLLGCIGIASAIQLYIREKLPSVAMLKCLGAQSRDTFAIFLLQVAALGFLGALAGALMGVGLQFLLPQLVGDLLPVALDIRWVPSVFFPGIGLGILMALLFAMGPLLDTLYISPLAALRTSEATTGRSNRASVFVLIVIFSVLFILAWILLDRLNYALGFVGGTAFVFLLLGGLGKWLMWAVRKWLPLDAAFELSHSLSNLFRPQNQTLILLLTIGVGSFLLSTLYFSRGILLAEATLEDNAANANLVLLDVQRDQQSEVRQILTTSQHPVVSDIPIVTMRVSEIKGIPVEEIRKDTTSQVDRWILDHEFRVTYRDTLTDSESLEAGTFPLSPQPGAAVPISVSRDFANNAVVEMDDTLLFNVQGRMLTTRVASIRTVDWSRPQPNFTLVFPNGILEQAPQFRVVTTRVSGPEDSAQLQRALVSRFPNISVLDLRQILSVVADLLDKISWIVSFMASFSILTGLIVLLGAVRSSRQQRAREQKLLHTLGAVNKQLKRITGMEYFFLGFLGALSGIVLSLAGSWALARFVFETTFIPSWIPFAVLLPVITLLVVFVGRQGSGEAGKQ